MPSQSSGSYTPGKVTLPPSQPLKTQSTARTYDRTNLQSPSSLSKQTGTSRTYQTPAVAKPLLEPDSATSKVINGEAVPVSGAKEVKISRKLSLKQNQKNKNRHLERTP